MLNESEEIPWRLSSPQRFIGAFVMESALQGDRPCFLSAPALTSLSGTFVEERAIMDLYQKVVIALN